jgi:hypothetical protein
MMGRLMLLAPLALVLAAVSPLAADTTTQTVTVTLRLDKDSKFTLSNPSCTAVKDGKATLSFDLNLYLATIPDGYEPTSDGRAPDPCGYDLAKLAKPEDVASAKGEVQGLYKLAAAQGLLKDDPSANGTTPLVLQDQLDNYYVVLGAIKDRKHLTSYVGLRTTKLKPYPGLDLNSEPLKLTVQIREVENSDVAPGFKVRMAEAYVTWRLQIPLDLSKTAPGDEANLIHLTATNRDNPGRAADQGSQQPATLGGGAAGAKADDTPADAGGTTPPANTDTTVAAAFAGALGIPAAALKSGPDYDIVAGFAVADAGTSPFGGIIGSFARSTNNLPWYSPQRLGLLGGRTGGGNPLWLIAPSYRVGSRMHAFLGEGFSNSDGNNRHGLVGGLAYSIGDALAAATGAEKPAQTAVVQTVEAKVDPDPQEPKRAIPRSSHRALVILYPVAGYEPAGLRLDCTSGPTGIGEHHELPGDHPSMTITKIHGWWWFMRYKGDTLTGAEEGTKPQPSAAASWRSVTLKIGGKQVGPKAGVTVDETTVTYGAVDPFAPGGLIAEQPPAPAEEPSAQTDGDPGETERTQQPAQPPTPAVAGGPAKPVPDTWLMGHVAPHPEKVTAFRLRVTPMTRDGDDVVLESGLAYEAPPVEVGIDGKFAVLLPHLEPGRTYHLEYWRAGMLKTRDNVTFEADLVIKLP